MSWLQVVLDKLVGFIPTAVAVVVIVLVMVAVRALLSRGNSGGSKQSFRSQIFSIVIFLIGLVVIILTLPVKDSTTGQLLSLLGILLSAAIALSATTFVGNMMAGLQMRAVKNFRAGDFVHVGDHFGRVSERGLFHVEIQTEDRDLTTLPNLYLVTNAVKVVRTSGTLVSAEVSLGYDVPRDVIETSLLEAAADTGLQEPFVHVMELGDFSITYRAAGLLEDVKSLLSVRSRLRKKMLDHLHAAGIEIVSPAFMNQRVLDPKRAFIPTRVSKDEGTELPEAVVFDKADEAESLEKLQQRIDELGKEQDELKATLSETEDYVEKRSIEGKIDRIERSIEGLKQHIREREVE